jgi:diaminopropionate ammonia-lyase
LIDVENTGPGARPLRIALNPLAEKSEYTQAEAQTISRKFAENALAEISQWQGYQLSPLVSLNDLARRLGLGRLLYKDESARLGQGSFKILGGAYAATVRLRERPKGERVTLCCATDGNHGRSVAYAAARAGFPCFVYMHNRASRTKAAAIEALGAKVVWVEGTYDDSIRHARDAAEKEGWLLIADTSEDEADPTTRLVMQGYGVMVLEILQQMAGEAPVTHVFMQGGVGGLAAGVAGVFADMFGKQRPRMIVVEPHSAACLFESALHCAPASVGGDLVTAMDMLSAGEASPVAWNVLKRRADVFVTIGDDAAIGTARLLSTPAAGFAGLNVGISGAAGLAGLVEVLRSSELASALELDHTARVLVFGTEAGTAGQ